jgi:hypothetical protein
MYGVATLGAFIYLLNPLMKLVHAKGGCRLMWAHEFSIVFATVSVTWALIVGAGC